MAAAVIIPDYNAEPGAVPFLRWARESIAVMTEKLRILEQGRNNTDLGQSSTIASLQQNIVDLDARVTAAIADITLDADAIVSGTFSPARIPSIAQSTVTGTWDKGVSTTADVSASNVTGTNVFAQSLSTLITATRVTLWGRTSDGYIATASSSERYKTNIRPTDIDPLAVLSIEPVYYEWIEQAQERERRCSLPKSDPEYRKDLHVATEVGMIAERLHEAGLWQFVVYQRESVYEIQTAENGDKVQVLTGERLVLDADGEPIPDGIHYINWGVALQVVARHLAAEHAQLRSEFDDLRAEVRAGR